MATGGFVFVFVFVFVPVFSMLKFYVFKLLPGAQQGTGDEEDNQDLLPWESLAFLIEQLFILLFVFF